MRGTAAVAFRKPRPETREDKKARRQKEKDIRELGQMGDKLGEYDGRLGQMGERNSMSKTDPDASFMRMKEDAMNNGQTKPGYNLQIATENQFLVDFGLFPNPGDTLTMPLFLTSFQRRYGRMASTAVADSGYGSEENYRFMEENSIEAYVKYNYFHMEQKRAFRENPFRVENLHYNAEGDYFVCPMGQHMMRVGTRRDRTESGYVIEQAAYRAQRCQGCPLRTRCHRKKRGNREIEVSHRLIAYKQRAREKLTSDKGLEHRSKKAHRAGGRVRADEEQHALQALPTLRQRQGHHGLCLLRHRLQHQENGRKNRKIRLKRRKYTQFLPFCRHSSFFTP